MTTITITLPEGVDFGTKANGEFVPVDLTKADETWLVEFLRYGVQRKLNDQFAGEKGNDKLERVREEVKAIHTGEARQVTMRRSVGSTVDPIRRMARGMAKDILLVAFKKATGLGKIADMCQKNEKIAAYFNVNADGKAMWDMGKLDAFIASKPGGRDFMAEAKAAMEVEVDLGF